MSERIKRLIKLISFDFDHPHWAICDISNPPASGYDEPVLLKNRKASIKDLTPIELEILAAIGEEYTPIEKKIANAESANAETDREVVYQSPNAESLTSVHSQKNVEETGDAGVNAKTHLENEGSTQKMSEELLKKVEELEKRLQEQDTLLKEAVAREVEAKAAVKKERIAKSLSDLTLSQETLDAVAGFLQAQEDSSVEDLVVKAIKEASQVASEKAKTETLAEVSKSKEESQEDLQKSAISAQLVEDLTIEKGTSAQVEDAAKDPVADKWQKQAEHMAKLQKKINPQSKSKGE